MASRAQEKNLLPTSCVTSGKYNNRCHFYFKNLPIGKEVFLSPPISLPTLQGYDQQVWKEKGGMHAQPAPPSVLAWEPPFCPDPAAGAISGTALEVNLSKATFSQSALSVISNTGKFWSPFPYSCLLNSLKLRQGNNETWCSLNT